MSEHRRETRPTVTLDVGTAYDFFESLAVLQDPKTFGVRGAWASGMLARLAPDARATLQRVKPFGLHPMHYLPTLPEPKNVETLLWSLAQLSPVDRVRALSCPWEMSVRGCQEVLDEVADRGRWGASDMARLGAALAGKDDKPPAEEKLSLLLDIWADLEAFGEAYLSALRNYHEVFFVEEERRIEPAIRAAGERIAERIGAVSIPDLIEEISAGVRYEAVPDVEELVLAPSFWVTPLLMSIMLGPKRRLLVFGARTSRDSLVPGESVPESLVRALKALADPTRLRTLRLISEQPMGAAELARTLRLRTPTMMHHLHALRLSELVGIQVPEPHMKEKMRYALRPQAVREVLVELDRFLGRTDEEVPADPMPHDGEKASEGGER